MKGAATARLLLLRHGESTLNASSTFTGLLDAPLSPAGEAQVGVAASLIAEAGLRPDLIVTTPMLRARRTTDLLLAGLGLTAEAGVDLGGPGPTTRNAGGLPAPAAGVPVVSRPHPSTTAAGGVREVVTWRLIERDYGCLTGLAKSDARALLGEDAFFTLRRTMNGRPPAASAGQEASWPLEPVADRGPLVPGAGESLADVVRRVRPVWADVISPALTAGEVVFVVAHGNSLRALCAVMEHLDDAETECLNIPAGHPLVYDVRDGVPRGGRYLDHAAARDAARLVAAEGGT